MTSGSSPKSALYGQLTRVAKALASPVRLELLDLLAQTPRTVDVLAGLLGEPVANTSHHLKVLRQAQLVETTRSAQFITYHLADAAVADLVLQMRAVADARLSEIQAITRTYAERRGLLEPVDQAELFRRIAAGDVTVIDVRPAAEYASGHLPGAICMPLDELSGRLHELSIDQEVIAYCRGPYCVMAVDAVALLRKHGFAAHRLDAGVVEWRARRRRTPPAGRRATAARPSKRPARVAR